MGQETLADDLVPNLDLETANRHNAKRQRGMAIENNAGEFYCQRLSQDCFVQAAVLLFFNLLCNIPVDYVTKIIFAHKSKKGYRLNRKWENKAVKSLLKVAGVKVREMKSLILYDNSILRPDITVIEAVSGSSTSSFNNWESWYKNRVAVRVFDPVGLSQSSTTKNIQSIIAWVDSVLMQRLVSYCLPLSDDKIAFYLKFDQNYI
ncbi:hypothetical protein QBC33DRAFT_519806 [Phialemonium atrogriseum]|uniref:Uncharacterized protein n=1 Tax=Phialemonium atrogriseum TaxID=1093897 RepID=A0AAJ0FII3_9PEZI|nr:uncharacterized protein QBC33DRAFT_519806 [Phialemonium atrogriseum]KAK1762135.1 hypothetical protein QBC33DRAFT_519806 [Phialemonium atrogriseum]